MLNWNNVPFLKCINDNCLIEEKYLYEIHFSLQLTYKRKLDALLKLYRYVTKLLVRRHYTNFHTRMQILDYLNKYTL